MATFSGEILGMTRNRTRWRRTGQRDISITSRIMAAPPGLSNKRFRLWLASRSQSNLTRWKMICVAVAALKTGSRCSFIIHELCFFTRRRGQPAVTSGDLCFFDDHIFLRDILMSAAVACFYFFYFVDNVLAIDHFAKNAIAKSLWS